MTSRCDAPPRNRNSRSVAASHKGVGRGKKNTQGIQSKSEPNRSGNCCRSFLLKERVSAETGRSREGDSASFKQRKVRAAPSKKKKNQRRRRIGGPRKEGRKPIFCISYFKPDFFNRR